MKHVMIDLETFGTRPGDAVISIGAVLFDPTGKGVHTDTFHQRIDLDNALAMGMKVEGHTIFWWMQQSEEARNSLESMKSQNMACVLLDFCSWWKKVKAEFLWAHPPTFDVTLLECAYRACDLQKPWSFRNVRDTKTLYDLVGGRPEVRRVGTHHSALDDAHTQALQVQKAHAMLAENGVFRND